jgi:hypothetical protein
VVLIWRVAELLLLIIAVIAVIASAALSRESGAASLLALFIAILSAVGVYFTDQRIKRLTEPKPIIIPTDFRGPLKVYLGKRRLMTLAAGVVMLLAPAPFMYESGKHGIAIACGIFGILLLLALLSDIRKMGMPYLMLDYQGITTHLYGRIPWGDVDNALLQVIETRGVKNYILGLSVYEPEKYFQRMGFLHRLFKLKWLELPSERDQLRISINMLSHEPLYIDAVVKHLRALYSRSIGVTPKTGDLSIDKKFSESDRLMNSLSSENNLATIRSTMTKIDGLMGESRQEIQGYYKKGRKESMIRLTVGLVLMGLLVAAILASK